MLEMKNIGKTFFKGTYNEKTVLENFSFHANKGDFISVVGSNGAGKSTIFNLIAGSFYPDCGRIFLDGEDITYKQDYIRSKKIGRLFQNPQGGTAPSMTVLENLTLSYLHAAKRKFGFLSKQEKEMIKMRIEALGLNLENRLNQPVGLLSGGERQALALLMATLVVPKLLLLDEHTAALDPITAQKVMEITNKTVSENNITCMMITHNLKAGLQYGNRIIMMNKGKIMLDIDGKERENITEEDLIKRFNSSSSEGFSDRMLLKEN